MPQNLEHSGASWKGQRLKHQDSLVDLIDPRVRVLWASMFAVLVVASNQIPALLSGLGISLILATLAKLNVKRTLRRVMAMDFFMLFLLVLLPFTTPGEPLLSVWGLTASKEGLLHALTIALKANAVVLCLLALVGTMSATTLGTALAHLKVSDKLVHLLLFTVRYLDVIGQEYKRMRRAMQARAFILKTNRHTWRSIGYLIGMLVVHSVERSERIMAAMKCRGYQGRFYLEPAGALARQDYLCMAAGLPIIGLLLGLNVL